MTKTKTEKISGAIVLQKSGPHVSIRKFVQLQKQGDDAFVNHVGDEGDGLFERDDDSVLCFNIENHPQRDEIENYMRHDRDTDTFCMPEPQPLPPAPLTEEEQYRYQSIINQEYLIVLAELNNL